MDQNDDNDQNKDIGDIVHKYYQHHGGMQQFYLDYYEFVNDMDNDNNHGSSN